MDRYAVDEHLLRMAEDEAKYGTCLRGNGVGAVLAWSPQQPAVRGSTYWPDKDESPTAHYHILARAHNTSLPGLPTCVEQGECAMVDGHCVRTLHSEESCILQWVRTGEQIAVGGLVTLYCTTAPCWNCFKSIAGVGLKRVVVRTVSYWETHPAIGTMVRDAARSLGILILHQPRK